MIQHAALTRIGPTRDCAGGRPYFGTEVILSNLNPATNTVVQGNFIGTGTLADGVIPLGNQQFGVSVRGPGNVIGGTAQGEGNVIAFTIDSGSADYGAGVIVFGSNTSGTIAGNSIYSNDGIGIDLGRDWVTPNDHCDGDSGGTSNSLQNYPVLTSAVSDGGQTTIQGTLDSTASTPFTVDFYSSPACDPSGFGEGQTYLGSATAMTDGSCSANFTTTLPVMVAAGQSITATATDPSGNTSEFSACRQATNPSGRVPDGSLLLGQVLTVTRVGGDINLSWGASCRQTDNDYEVYEGSIGTYYSHTSRFCTTGGMRSITFTPASGGRYYLIVPRNDLSEGSYGVSSNATERPQGNTACRQQVLGGCPSF